MFGRCTFIPTWCCLLILSLLSMSLGQFLFDEEGSLYKTCDNYDTFKQYFDTTLHKCAEECYRRQRCETVMFHHKMKFCALKEYVDITELEYGKPVCLYYRLNYELLEKSSLGPCINHRCRANERCTEKTEDEYDCKPSECSAPRKIDNAYIMSNTHDIGTKNRYKCHPGYFGMGEPTITCDTDANWTPTDFHCRLQCPTPIGSYINGELTTVEGEGFIPGTVLHFTCRDGYMSDGDTATSTCQEYGSWLPEKVECCHDNSTHFWDRDCIKAIDVDNAGSNTEAENYCISLGGYWGWANYSTKGLFDDKPDVRSVLQTIYKTWYTEHWNYTACAEENGETGNTNQHIDAMINEAIDKDWNGAVCEVVNNWMPDEPNGGDQENCIFLDRDLYYYFDSLCNFNRSSVGFVCGFSLPFVY